MRHRLGLGEVVGFSHVLVYGFTGVAVFTPVGDVELEVLALWGEVAVTDAAAADGLFANVDLFKDPNGLPGPRFLVRVGRLLSEGSNTFLAL